MNKTSNSNQNSASTHDSSPGLEQRGAVTESRALDTQDRRWEKGWLDAFQGCSRHFGWLLRTPKPPAQNLTDGGRWRLSRAAPSWNWICPRALGSSLGARQWPSWLSWPWVWSTCTAWDQSDSQTHALLETFYSFIARWDYGGLLVFI